MQLHIRQAYINDAATLTKLSIKTFCDTFAAHNSKEDMDHYLSESLSEQQMINELQDENSRFYFYLENDVPIGYIKLRSGYEPEELTDKNALEIERLYVDKDHHNKKIGAALMQFAIHLARQQGFTAIWLGVWVRNHKAINFYEAWGFEPFGTHNFQLGSDMQIDLLMVKRI